jgi:hypothetical protein
MKNLMKSLAIFLLGFSLSASASWTGPQVMIGNKNGRKVITICDQGGSCTSSTPFFLALNAQTAAIGNHDWTTFMYEAQLQLNYVSANANGIVPMLQVVVLNTSDAFIDELASHLNQLSPRPYLYMRMYLETVQQPGMEKMQILDMQGHLHDDTGGEGSPWALNEAWLSYQEGEITRVLNRIDAQYPGRVMGLNIGYELGGEWFFRPYGYDTVAGKMLDWGDPSLCGTGVNDGVTTCGLFPWSNDSGTQPGPSGRHYFFLDDYSTTSTTGFCSWALLPTSLQTNCRAADIVERNNAVLGQAMPLLGKERGVFLDPADTSSLRAAYYNRYLSEQNVNAIIRLLAKAKQVSGNQILTSTFYGYYYGLSVSMPTSGHNAMTSLLASSAIDIVAAPYSYGESRQLDNAFSPQGLPDSPGLANKLWFDEDDTRTHFTCSPSCVPGPFQSATNLWDSIRVLRRNLLTAGIHGHGSYFLDLGGTGWFGRPDMASDSDALWANLTNAFTAINKIQMGAPNRFDAQVAVFVDDLSPNYIAGFTPAGDSSFGFSTDLYNALEDSLSHLGTPVKHYLLSDLLKSNIDLSTMKLAILPNAFNVPSNIRQAIDTKLRTPYRTLLFLYAAGYLNADSPASVSNISSLTGINVSLGSGTPPLSETFTVNGQSIPGGPGYPLTPWFTVTDTAALAEGWYSAAPGSPVSLARKVIPISGAQYTSIFAAAPNLPLPVLRHISEAAGVHHYVPAGDIVESSGNMLLVHAATTGYKTITFPQVLPRIFETALYPSDTLMCNNCNQLTQLPFNDGDTRAFRWTSPPLGNFETITGTTVSGWATDPRYAGYIHPRCCLCRWTTRNGYKPGVVYCCEFPPRREPILRHLRKSRILIFDRQLFQRNPRLYLRHRC